MWREKLKIVKSNPVAGLYPFTKMWIMVFYFFILIVLGTADFRGYPVYLMVALAILLFLVGMTGITKKFFSIFSKLFLLAAIIFIAQCLLFPGDVLVWNQSVFGLFTLQVFENGLRKGLTLALGILSISGIFVWFFQCTENKEIIRACEKRGMSPKTGYVLLSTLQMIAVLQQSSKIIMSAQEARGVETKGNLKTRMRAFMPALIPLVLGAITNTEERVLTLESKGFTVKCHKTSLFDVEPNGKETIATIAAIIIAVLVAGWRIAIWML